MVVVIFGPPGSGKGTQSVKIAEEFGLVHFSTGEMLRLEMDSGTELGKKIHYIAQGGLVDDETITEFVDARLDDGDVILDGFPRTIPQASSLERILGKRGASVQLVLSLEVEEDELVRRIRQRALSSNRTDDGDEVILRRLAEYRSKTEPVKEYYREQGKLVSVPDGTKEEVFQFIKQAIWQTTKEGS